MGAPIALALDPDDPNFVVAVLTDSDDLSTTKEGLWFSLDAGLSWTHVDFPSTITCGSASVDEQELFAGTNIVYDLEVHPNVEDPVNYDRRAMLLTSHADCGLLDVDFDTGGASEWEVLNEYNCRWTGDTSEKEGIIHASRLRVLEHSKTADDIFYIGSKFGYDENDNIVSGLCRINTDDADYPAWQSMHTVWRPKADIEGIAAHPEVEEVVFTATAVDAATREECVQDSSSPGCDVPGPHVVARRYTAEAGIVDTADPARPIWEATALDTTGLPSLRGGPVAWGYHNGDSSVQSTLIYTARGSGGYRAEVSW